MALSPADPLAGAALPGVLSSIEPDRIAVHEAALPADETGGGWRIDLAGRFVARSAAGDTWSGECRVIGTWNPADQTMLWAWANPSVPAGRTLRSQACALPAIASLTRADRFAASDVAATQLAQWIAWKTGWRGFVAEHGGDPLAKFGAPGRLPTLVFIAVRPPGARSPTPPACGMCRGTVPEVGALRSGAIAGVCDACMATGRELAAEHPCADPQQDPVSEHQEPCVLCGRKRPRIFGMDGGALCFVCLSTANAPR